jgi:hypothetical protein
MVIRFQFFLDHANGIKILEMLDDLSACNSEEETKHYAGTMGVDSTELTMLQRWF